MEKMHYRLLSDITIGIIGFGDIGQEIAKYCKSMKMTVYSVHREISLPKMPFVDNAFSIQNLSDCLKRCDYFCNVLPSTPATRGLLSGNVLKSCKEKKTVLINIGRGDVVHEDSILKALDNEWIGGAILDVFEVEPLPCNSPLWSHPLVTITPHCAGLSTEKEVICSFLVNT